MNKPILFSLFQEKQIKTFQLKKIYEVGKLNHHVFPDGESLIQFKSKIKNREIIFVDSLNSPNEKILPLILAAETARQLGAKKITLFSPYLGYMRQDKQFKKGEGVTAIYFAHLLSNYFDALITIDAHLHRIQNLEQIYNIPASLFHATDAISNWVLIHVKRPLFVGPDKESKQWVATIANKIKAPYVVLNKIRKGDQSVTIRVGNLSAFKGYTPILVDDIISSGKTIIEAAKRIKEKGFPMPMCIAVHAVFAKQSFEEMKKAGIKKIITCDSINHMTNKISIVKEVLLSRADCIIPL